RNPGIAWCACPCRRAAMQGPRRPRTRGKSDVEPGPWNNSANGQNVRQFKLGPSRDHRNEFLQGEPSTSLHKRHAQSFHGGRNIYRPGGLVLGLTERAAKWNPTAESRTTSTSTTRLAGRSAT